MFLDMTSCMTHHRNCHSSLRKKFDMLFYNFLRRHRHTSLYMFVGNLLDSLCNHFCNYHYNYLCKNPCNLHYIQRLV